MQKKESNHNSVRMIRKKNCPVTKQKLYHHYYFTSISSVMEKIGHEMQKKESNHDSVRMISLEEEAVQCRV